jgi:hypothetical protein
LLWLIWSLPGKPMIPTLFSSGESYRDAFASGLSALLKEYDELGVYILVLANAGFSEAIWERLSGQLEGRFRHLLAGIREAKRKGLLLDDAEDDLEVFRDIAEHGFERLEPTRFRQVGPWELQFNQLRAFRPPRMTNNRTYGLSAPFDPDGFHFSKPYLRKEMIYHGNMLGKSISLFYNKFPFVDMHSILVPNPREGHPQFLLRPDHDYIWRLTESLAETMPGVGFGYNSYGAYASVNHLHFQMFVRSKPLPVSVDCWRHNGGAEPYPASCYRFDSKEEAWRMIGEFHGKGTPYNLVYLPGSIYCLPRMRQGEIQPPAWSRGFAWYEMAGGFVSFSESEFTDITECQIAEALKGIVCAENSR